MIRLLAVHIANGFSSEASVFSTLLGCNVPEALSADILCHSWCGDRATATGFCDLPGTTVHPIDFAWRPRRPGDSIRQRLLRRRRFLASLPGALAHARRIDPDVIYSSQQRWDCAAATYFAQRMGKPQIIHLHYKVGPWLGRKVLRRLKTCELVLTVSDFIREQAVLHRKDETRVVTVRNAIAVRQTIARNDRDSMRESLGLQESDLVIGMASRLDPEKGQDDTIRAFSVALKRMPRACLVIAGAESPWCAGYGRTLVDLAARLGLTDRIRFLGQRVDVPALLGAFDVFAHPSRADPCPLAVLEAAAAGLPIAAYAEGGALELVQHGRTGLLAVPGDVEDLANHLSALLESSALRSAMGAAGRLRVLQDFRPEDAARRFRQVVAHATSGFPGSSAAARLQNSTVPN